MVHLFSLLLCGLAFSASAQISTPVPTAIRPGTDLPHNQHTYSVGLRLRQPELLPAGGFWISEETLQKTSPVIIRYYNDQQQELQADTLIQKRINLKNRGVVRHLNERLADVLRSRHQPVALSHQTP